MRNGVYLAEYSERNAVSESRSNTGQWSEPKNRLCSAENHKACLSSEHVCMYELMYLRWYQDFSVA